MKEWDVSGIIGYTDTGEPIVGSDHSCIYFKEQDGVLSSAHECWYCLFSDFRKTCEVVMTQSICHCAENRLHSAME